MAGPTTSRPHGDTFACSGCGARYKWRSELAGRTIRCKKCGQAFTPAPTSAPASPPASASPRALSPADLAAAAGARSGFIAPPRRGARPAAVDPDEPTALHNWILPAIVLAGGLAWRLSQAGAHAGRFDSVSLPESLGLVLAEWLVVGVAVAAGVLAGAMFGVDVEPILPAAFKVLATSLLMCAAAQFCSSFDRSFGDMWGLTLGVPCVLLVAYFMLAAMFRAELLEGLMATLGVTLLACGMMFALATLIGGEAGVVLAFGRPAA